MMRSRAVYVLSVLVYVLFAPLTEAQYTRKIVRFDDLALTPFGGAVETEDVVFEGGRISYATNDTFNRTRRYITAGPQNPGSGWECVGCSTTLRMTFKEPVSEVAFLLSNGASHPYNSTWYYYIYDNHGNTWLIQLKSFEEYAFAQYPYVARIDWPFKDVEWIAIDGPSYNFVKNGIVGTYWNFDIDEITYRIADAQNKRLVAVDNAAGGPYEEVVELSGEVPEVTIPLGSTFELRYEAQQKDGTWQAVPIDAYSGSHTLLNLVSEGAWFKDIVCKELSDDSSDTNKVFLASHLGEASVALAPTDGTLPTATTKIRIEPPSGLGLPGKTNPDGNDNIEVWDEYFIEAADYEGLPPQALKAIGYQESNKVFDPLAWRYEPRPDRDIIQPWLTQNQFNTREYNLSTPNTSTATGLSAGANLCRNDSNQSSPGCIFPALDDVSPRNELRYKPNCTASAIQIDDTLEFITARQIIEGSGAQQNKWPPSYCPPPGTTAGSRGRPVSRPDPYAFTAQTPMASSWGVMQLTWYTAVDYPVLWTGHQSRVNPSLLFDTPENLARHQGSIGIGARVLRTKLRTEPKGQSKTDILAHVKEGFRRYNGAGPDAVAYSELVAGYLPYYHPRRSSSPVIAYNNCVTDTSLEVDELLGEQLLARVVGETQGTTWYRNGERLAALDGEEAALLDATAHYVVQFQTMCGAPRSLEIPAKGECPTPSLRLATDVLHVSAGAPVVIRVLEYDQGTIEWYEGESTLPESKDPIGIGPELELTVDDSVTLTAVLRNTCGKVSRADLHVDVCDSVQITRELESTTISEGESAVLTIETTGTDLSYEWFRDGLPIQGASGRSLTVSPMTTTRYSVEVSNTCEAVRSAEAIVAVTTTCETPEITGPPASTTTTAGNNVTLTVAATGTDLIYQWYQDDNAISGATTNTISLRPTETTTYRVVVTNACGSAESAATITTTSCAVPNITQQPSNATITAGESVTLTVAATSENLEYQWYNDATIAGATGSTITVNPTITTSYTVIVSNACGEVQSTAATITVVCPAPTITTPLQSLTVTEGSSATLTVEAAGESLSYQWFANDMLVTGATTPSLTVKPTIATTYTVIVSNACGTAESTATVTVTSACEDPQITSQPQHQTITEGDSTTLIVSASGTDLSYQWYVAGSPITGATGTNVTVNPESTTSYTAIVSNACGTAESMTAIVTVIAACEAPQITSHPQSTTITEGDSVNLAVEATGTDVSYQWYTGGSLIGGATVTSLTVSPTTTTTYTAIVANTCGTVESVDATVAVIPACTAPQVTSHLQSATITLGESTTLSFAASGTNLTYQWYSNGSLLLGATTETLIVAPGATTTYNLVVTNSCGTADSEAIVTVTIPCESPQITSQPVSGAILKGGLAQLSVTATGTDLSYQWYVGFSGDELLPVLDGTSPMIFVSPEVTSSYWVKVWNACGSANTEAADIFVVECGDGTCVDPVDPEYRVTITAESTRLDSSLKAPEASLSWATPDENDTEKTEIWRALGSSNKFRKIGESTGKDFMDTDARQGKNWYFVVPVGRDGKRGFLSNVSGIEVP